MKKTGAFIRMAGVAAAVVFSAAAVAQQPAPAAPAPAPAPAPAAPAPAAPAAAGENKLPSWMEYKPVYSGEENNIANPHRTREEITTWGQQVAAEVLTLSQMGYSQKMEGFKKYFIADGWNYYTQYLTSTRALEMVAQGYDMNTIVADVPEIVNQGASNGVYHWILRMPVTIGFYKKDAASGAIKTGPSGKFYLFMDIMRVSEGGDNGIAITNWRIVDTAKR